MRTILGVSCISDLILYWFKLYFLWKSNLNFFAEMCFKPIDSDNFLKQPILWTPLNIISVLPSPLVVYKSAIKPGKEGECVLCNIYEIGICKSLYNISFCVHVLFSLECREKQKTFFIWQKVEKKGEDKIPVRISISIWYSSQYNPFKTIYEKKFLFYLTCDIHDFSQSIF